MKKQGLYTSGEFAKKAHVTKKTLRYYNDHGFLKPSFTEENGYKLYTDRDFEKIQRILLLKYLGFSLEEIKNTEPEMPTEFADILREKTSQYNNKVLNGSVYNALKNQAKIEDNRAKFY